MNANGSGVRQVTRMMAQNIHPFWAPDGSRILFNTTSRDPQAKRYDLATISPDGTDMRLITRSEDVTSYTYGSFSPDGLSIVYRRLQGDVSQVFLMNSDGSDNRNLSGTSTQDYWPSWSPDGKRIVFSRQGNSGFQIFVMNRDGKNLRQLTDASGEFTNPRWAPNGKKLLCGRRLGGPETILSINLVLFEAPS